MTSNIVAQGQICGSAQIRSDQAGLQVEHLVREKPDHVLAAQIRRELWGYLRPITGAWVSFTPNAWMRYCSFLWSSPSDAISPSLLVKNALPNAKTSPSVCTTAGHFNLQPAGSGPIRYRLLSFEQLRFHLQLRAKLLFAREDKHSTSRSGFAPGSGLFSTVFRWLLST